MSGLQALSVVLWKMSGYTLWAAVGNAQGSACEYLVPFL